MFNTSWSVLLVDDEPDVLALSTLVMKDFTVYGLPLELNTAASKAEAIELMESKLIPILPTVPPPRVAVAFIDIVMESDTAGLELCRYIRNTMGNKVLQIFIRTGQPGMAPERMVIDQYDINGYFTKAEATEDKLYSLVKSGVRQYLSYVVATITPLVVARMTAAATTRDSMQRFLQMSPLMQREGHYMFIDGKGIAGSLMESDAKGLLERLDRIDGQMLGSGDKFVVDNNQNMLLKIGGTYSKAELAYVVAGDWKYLPPDTVKSFLHSLASTAAALWKQAG